MYMNIGRGCVIAGMLMILHAGLGSAHHRANLRLSEQPYDGNITVVMLIFSHMTLCFVYLPNFYQVYQFGNRSIFLLTSYVN